MAQGAWGKWFRVQVVQGAVKSVSFPEVLHFLQAPCGCEGGGERESWRREGGGVRVQLVVWKACSRSSSSLKAAWCSFLHLCMRLAHFLLLTSPTPLSSFTITTAPTLSPPPPPLPPGVGVFHPT